MSSIVKKNDVESILGYELLDEEFKNQIVQNPKIKQEIEKWTNDYVQNRHLFGIKECNVEYIDYNAVDLDEFEDEIDRKNFLSKVKKNERNCPNHRSCPIFINNLIKNGEKCILELADARVVTAGLFNELDIKEEDYNDQIILAQLVSTNILANRALRGLSAEALVQPLVTYSNGGVKHDTKVNEHFTIFDKSMNMSEKLRKSLVLNRDDKIKYKKLKEGKDKATVNQNVKNIMKEAEKDFEISEIVDMVKAKPNISDKENIDIPKEIINI